VVYDANLLRNSALEDGLAGWAALGACTKLAAHEEEPANVPTETINDVADDYKPSGRYILATGRACEEDGLCQAITGSALKPRITYRVAGWISLGDGTKEEAVVRVNIRLGGDGEEECLVVEGGVVCAEAAKWTEIKGVFRLKGTLPSGAAAVHVQGAPAGVDVKVMDLQVFAVDRKARFKKLKKKTDKVSSALTSQDLPVQSENDLQLLCFGRYVPTLLDTKLHMRTLYSLCMTSSESAKN
jgi:hypothetical protein